MKSRVGLALGYDPKASVSQMAGAAADAERRGFDMVFFSETLFSNRDSVSALAAFALATRRVALGATQVVRLRGPLLMAQTAASLDELSDGRLVLALGAYTPMHAAKHGVELTDPLPTLREYVRRRADARRRHPDDVSVDPAGDGHRRRARPRSRQRDDRRRRLGRAALRAHRARRAALAAPRGLRGGCGGTRGVGPAHPRPPHPAEHAGAARRAVEPAVRDAIQSAAGLGFLGLGAQPPTAEWGAMLADSRVHMRVAPMLVAAPGLAIMIATTAFNLLGDGLRDALDVRLRAP